MRAYETWTTCIEAFTTLPTNLRFSMRAVSKAGSEKSFGHQKFAAVSCNRLWCKCTKLRTACRKKLEGELEEARREQTARALRGMVDAFTSTEVLGPDPAVLASQVLDLEGRLTEETRLRQNVETALHSLRNDESSLRAAMQRSEELHETETSGLRRTIDNLKESLAHQDDAHRHEIADLEEDFRLKVEEKRSAIRSLQNELEALRRRSGLDVASRDAVLTDNATWQARLDQRCAQYEAELASMREGEDALRQQNQRLVAALQTLRQQLIAVDSANRSMVARHTEQDRALKAKMDQIESLQRQLHESIASQKQLKERVQQLAAAALTSS